MFMRLRKYIGSVISKGIEKGIGSLIFSYIEIYRIKQRYQRQELKINVDKLLARAI